MALPQPPAFRYLKEDTSSYCISVCTIYLLPETIIVLLPHSSAFKEVASLTNYKFRFFFAFGKKKKKTTERSYFSFVLFLCLGDLRTLVNSVTRPLPPDLPFYSFFLLQLTLFCVLYTSHLYSFPLIYLKLFSQVLPTLAIYHSCLAKNSVCLKVLT